MFIKYLLSVCFLFYIQGCDYDKKTKWVMLNVNELDKQGDAHIISKGASHFMIDTGQQYYVRSVVIPYLKKHRITHLKGILITHPHFDHYGGTKDLIESGISIETLYMNMPTQAQMKREWWGGYYSDLIAIRESAKKHHIKIVPVKRGDIYAFDKKSYIKVLYAYDGIHTPVGTTDINDMSVIAMFHDGDNKFLFTGDLNKKLGAYLATHARDIKADILKFPHHGTEGFAPNTFFDAVSPEVVLVPGPSYLWCSKRSKRARELVKDNHYTAYVNGFHGNVTVLSNEKTYKISTQNKSHMICKK